MSRCEGCPYPGERSCGSRGPLDADVVFVGEAPGRSEELAGEPFVGPTGQLLEEILERVLGGAQVYRLYTNAMACRPPEEKSPYLEGIVACRQRLLDEVNAHPRKLVVAMGNSAVRALTGLESPKISSLRGKLMTSDLVNAPVFPVFHPAAVLRQKSLFHTLADDLERAMGRVSGRRIRVRPGSTSHRVVSSMEEAEACALDMSEHGVVAVDIETTGLDKRLDRIIAVGLCVEAGRAAIVPAAYMRALAPLLEGRMEGKPRFLYHNGRFDAGFLRNNRIEARVDEDTLLLSYCLDEQPGRHGLKQLSNDILGAPDYELPLQAYKKEHNIVGDYSQIPEHILFPYLAMDVDYTLQLYHELMPAVFGVPALRALYQQLLIPASDLLTEVERTGFWVDPLRIEVAREVLTERKVLAADRLAELARRHWVFDVYKQWLNPEAWERGRAARVARESKRDALVAKRLAQQEEIDRKNVHRSERFDARRASSKQADAVRPPRMLKPAASPPAPLPEPYAPEFNPGSPQQVRWMLKQWDIEVESTDSKTLEPFQEDSTFVQWLLLHRKASKLLGTYVEGITRAISDDGRIHANFNLSSTVTGRLSSSEPLNLQNIPRDPLLRGIFGAPRGRIIVEADYSQCIAEGAYVPYGAGWVRIQDHPAAICKGVSPTVTVTTKKGFSLSATADHRVMTYKGWAPISSLEEGMWVAMDRSEPEVEEFDERQWLVGFWAADGSLYASKGGVSFAQKTEPLTTEVEAIIERVLGERPRRWGTALGLTAQRGFKAEMLDLFDKKNLSLPLHRLTHPASVIAGLIDGDGSIDKNGVALGTIHLQLVKDVQQALLRYGVLSAITGSWGGFNFSEHGTYCYQLRISDSISLRNFARYIPLQLSTRKANLAHLALRPRTRDGGNHVPVPVDLMRGRLPYRPYVLNHTKGQPYTRFMLETIEDRTFCSEYERYHWDRIVSVRENEARQAVYDLMDQPEERFCASGFVVHNCELRMLAHLSGDPFLREVYDHDRDLHAEVARGIFGENFTPEQRSHAKVINFGIAYGMSGYGLSKQLKIGVEEAERMIASWYDRLPMARAYLDSCKQAPMDGRVLVTPFGRHRRYGLIDNDNAESIQREASNMVIQSAASDLTLISAILLREPLADMGAKIVNIVHDSILVECDDNPDTIKQVATAMLATMRRVPAVALQTAIPFDADAKYGSHWGVDTTKFKEGA